MKGTPGKTNSPKAARERKRAEGKTRIWQSIRLLHSAYRAATGFALGARGLDCHWWRCGRLQEEQSVCVCMCARVCTRVHLCVCAYHYKLYHSVMYCFLRLS